MNVRRRAWFTASAVALLAGGAFFYTGRSASAQTTYTDSTSGTVSFSTAFSPAIPAAGTTTLDTLVFSNAATSAQTDDLTAATQPLNANVLTFSNTGTLTLTQGAGTTITLGGTTPTVNLNNSAAVTNNLATVLGANTTFAGTGAGVTTFGGIISGTGFGITKNGTSTLALSGANTYSGGTTVNAGTLISNVANALGGTGATVTLAGGTLSLRGNGANNSAVENIAYNKNITVTGNSTLDVARFTQGGQKTIQNAGGLNIGGQTLTITDQLGFALVFQGATTVSGNATFQNNMNSTGSGGLIAANPNGFTLNTLTVADSVATGTATNVTFGVVATGFSNGVNNTGNTFVTGAITNNATDATKTLGITKTGAGMLTLAGTNTYTGTTTVSGGTLLVSGSTASGSAVTVNGGTLAGSGTVAGTVAVGSTSAGAIAPSSATSAATGSIGMLTTGTLTLGSNATSLFDLNGTTTKGTSFDNVNSTGAVTFGGVLTLSLNSGYAPTGTTVYDLFDFTSANGTFATLTPLAGYTESFNYATGELTLTAAVPEPGTWAVLFAGVGLLGARRFFRRRSPAQS